MIGTISLLLLCQLIGEISSRVAGLPVPGPVVGMLLLFVALVARGGVPKPVEDTASRLLAHLGLLFVPAGVGIVQHLDRIRSEWFALGATLVLSTAIAVGVTGVVLSALLSRADG